MYVPGHLDATSTLYAVLNSLHLFVEHFQLHSAGKNILVYIFEIVFPFLSLFFNMLYFLFNILLSFIYSIILHVL